MPPPEPVNDQYGTLASRDANEVSFTFNEDEDQGAGNDTFSASFRLHADDLEGGEEKGGILINFGDLEPPGQGSERRSIIRPRRRPCGDRPARGHHVYRDGDISATFVGTDGAAALANRQFFNDPEQTMAPIPDNHTENFSSGASRGRSIEWRSAGGALHRLRIHAVGRLRRQRGVRGHER